MMKIDLQSPVLMSKSKTGKTKCWVAEILRAEGEYYLGTTYWQQDEAWNKTKVQSSVPYPVFGKNQGRANETSAAQQAILEFDALVKRQRDKGYAEEGEKADILTQPMLAHKFKDHHEKVEFPCFVQPKLNGMRMLTDGKKAWSRGGKIINPQCVEHLMFDTCDLILDGELILPNNPLLQETMKAAKKFYPDKSPDLLYCVYDVVEPNSPFCSRHEMLQILRTHAPHRVVLVPTHLVNNSAEVATFHERFKEGGYEGSMIRSSSMKYESGSRSYSLLKLKDFQDDEFEILDVLEGGGSDKGLAIFVCVTPGGVQFNCRPEGTRAVREGMWKNREILIGKMLTIRYQDLSNDGVPQFPVGVTIREPHE